MSGKIEAHPVSWEVFGSIAPLELSKYNIKEFYKPYKCEIEVQEEILIDNLHLKLIQLIPNE